MKTKSITALVFFLSMYSITNSQSITNYSLNTKNNQAIDNVNSINSNTIIPVKNTKNSNKGNLINAGFFNNDTFFLNLNSAHPYYKKFNLLFFTEQDQHFYNKTRYKTV